MPSSDVLLVDIVFDCGGSGGWGGGGVRRELEVCVVVCCVMWLVGAGN